MAELKQVIEAMNKKPYLLNMGAGSLARIFKTTRNVIYDAKDMVRASSNKHVKKGIKILIFDIETSPLLSYVFQKQVWNARITNDKIVSDWLVLCWSAKWLGSAEIMADKLTPDEILGEYDYRIINTLWKLFNEADVIVAHNAKGFDIPNMNSKFIIYDLNPPTPYSIVDTLDVARKRFGFTHNNLDYLCKIFGFPAKLPTDFSLWRGCMLGNQESIDKMQEYNINDVAILEEVYLKLRPWMNNHPNMSVYSDETVVECCNCGSKHVTKLPDQFYYSAVGKYEIYRCECGAISRGRVNLLSKEKAKSLITRIPK